MKAKELAEILDGNEYRYEINRDLARKAKKNKLVVIFGASDDLMEWRGFIKDESDVYEGGTRYVTKDGILQIKCYADDCPYFEKEKKQAHKIEAVWCENEKYLWTYKTDIPHETFDIYEDGETYCRGIVFSMGDLK
jgi:hypothetical protein